MTITHENDSSTAETGAVPFLWVEVTSLCQLECVQCYAGSGPTGSHGTMTPSDWEQVLTEAAGKLGTQLVCFIGGEPSLLSALPSLVRHTLDLGMEAEVYTNLVSVSPALWELYRTPGVRLATSWYTNDRLEHKQITMRDTFRQTLGNIETAVGLGIPLRAGIITGLLPNQHWEEGTELLQTRGVTNVGIDHLREFGRGTKADPSQACGGCGYGRAAILPDGSVTPCPLTRWMIGGNVHQSGLNGTLERVKELAESLPTPAQSHKPVAAYGPNRAGTVENGGCQPTCIPDSYCNPLCSPGACKPRIS